MNFFRTIFTGVVSFIMMFGGITTMAQTSPITPEGLEYLKLTNNSNMDLTFYICDEDTNSSVYEIFPYTGYETKIILQDEIEKIYYTDMLFSGDKDLSLKVLPYREFQFNYTVFDSDSNDPRHPNGDIALYGDSALNPCAVDDLSDEVPILGEYEFVVDMDNPTTQALNISGNVLYTIDTYTDSAVGSLKGEISDQNQNNIIVRSLSDVRTLDKFNIEEANTNLAGKDLCLDETVFFSGDNTTYSHANQISGFPYPGIGFTSTITSPVSALYVDKFNDCSNDLTNTFNVIAEQVDPGNIKVFTPSYSDSTYSKISLIYDEQAIDPELEDNDSLDIMRQVGDINEYCINGVQTSLSSLNSTPVSLSVPIVISIYDFFNATCESESSYTFYPFSTDNWDEFEDLSLPDPLDTYEFEIDLQTKQEFTLEFVETLSEPTTSGYYFDNLNTDFGLCYFDGSNYVEFTSSSNWNESDMYLNRDHTTALEARFSLYNKDTQLCSSFQLNNIGNLITPNDSSDDNEYEIIKVGYLLRSPADFANPASDIKSLTITTDSETSIPGEVFVSASQITTTEPLNIQNACGYDWATAQLEFDEVPDEDIFISTFPADSLPPLGNEEFHLLSCGFETTYDRAFEVIDYSYTLSKSQFDAYLDTGNDLFNDFISDFLGINTNQIADLLNVKFYVLKNDTWNEVTYTLTEDNDTVTIALDSASLLGTSGLSTFNSTSANEFDAVAITYSLQDAPDTTTTNTNTDNSNASATGDTQNNTENTTSGQQNLVRTGGGAVMGIVFGLAALVGFGYVTQRRKEIKADLN